MESGQGRNYAHLMPTIAQLKQDFPLVALMERLGFREHTKRTAFCPFHENKESEAFSVYPTANGMKWNCFTGCGGGDELDFLMKAEGLEKGAAFKRWAELAGAVGPLWPAYTPSRTHAAQAVSPRPELTLPSDFHKGNREELQAVATLRNVNLWAVATMQQNGILGFGTVCGLPCWIVTDGARHCAEARCMDGAWFPEIGTLGVRKAHTLKGSVKSWPVGLGMPADMMKHFGKVLLLEGSGDLAAGYHYAEPVGSWLPVAVLGAGMSRLHPEVSPLLRGKRVRIVSHVDPAGIEAREKMRRELLKTGCAEVDWFDLEGLRKADGSPIKDLNDCTDIHAEDADEMGGLLK